ncbi:AbrB/MazE/SpoVT family DNA-binding domain-containing protein [Leucobacter insecticola]|uniref:AbrB/MazE/SpoVT family DNA-binding domain-containing protein n=1 Tax=Leucobacter insecticola TaxID=2714934 RepID=A0A6G8FGY6_9MICO|nr:AbrB/MazE/SpoVT family DNA-binding domain-containing protein [Leucobacter insecticola]QIM15614.1 AbrB/MazE/SpoVT family DNA-binding domain-containing protein [Leucobacter insecticola]
MKTTIDSAGRMVIPKAIRTQMGLIPGTPVDIVYSEGRIVIEYAPVEVEVRKVGRLKVLQPTTEMPVLTDEIVRETLEAVRNEVRV